MHSNASEVVTLNNSNKSAIEQYFAILQISQTKKKLSMLESCCNPVWYHVLFVADPLTKKTFQASFSKAFVNKPHEIRNRSLKLESYLTSKNSVCYIFEVK